MAQSPPYGNHGTPPPSYLGEKGERGRESEKERMKEKDERQALRTKEEKGKEKELKYLRSGLHNR